MNANLTDMIQNSEASVSHAEGMIRNFFDLIYNSTGVLLLILIPN